MSQYRNQKNVQILIVSNSLAARVWCLTLSQTQRYLPQRLKKSRKIDNLFIRWHSWLQHFISRVCRVCGVGCSIQCPRLGAMVDKPHYSAPVTKFLFSQLCGILLAIVLAIAWTLFAISESGSPVS